MANEEREQEEKGLGELPSDLRKERGDLYPDVIDYMSGSVPADIAGSIEAGNAPTVLGDRTIGASVRSVFSTRPINATDFHFTQYQNVTPTPETGATLSFTYTVPESYIAVLREFEFYQTPYIIAPESELLLSIKINGITQVGHSNLPMIQNPGSFKTHIIAPENSQLTLFLNYQPLYSDAIEFTVWAHLYGNLILTQNRPAAFEVGNAEPTKSIPVPTALGGSGTNPGGSLTYPIKPSPQTPRQPRKKFPGFSKKGTIRGSTGGRLNIPIKKR